MKKNPRNRLLVRYILGGKIIKKVNTSYEAAAESATAATTTAVTRRRLNRERPRASRSNARLIEGTDRV